jgi:cellulose biosynthesis protein BcsQ
MAPPYTRNTDTNEALNALAELEVFKVAPPILRQRIAFARSTPLGMVVSELGPNAKKAAYEMQALYDLLYLDGKVE